MTAWLEIQAQARPTAPALVDGNRRLNFADLAERSAALAAVLAAAGVRCGDRVMLQAPVGLETAVWVHAVLWLGATLVPIGPALPPARLSELVRRLRPRAFVTPEPDAPGLPDRLGGCIAIDSATVPRPGLAPVEAAEYAPMRCATIMLTSGSSSAPRAVPLSLENHLASTRAIAERIGLASDDNWLLCLPLDHIGGLAILVRSVIMGSNVVIHRRFDPQRVVCDFAALPITFSSLVPSMLERILEEQSARFSSSLRGLLIGGAPARAGLLARARGMGLPVLPTWGMTEACSQLATASPAEAARIDFRGRPGIAGRPLPGVELRNGPGGALQVRGPMLFPGYLDAEAAGPDPDGWFTTGDCGGLDLDGYLRITGRVDNIIISGGVNVHLEAVAQRLSDAPMVREAAVAAIDDARWGQRIAAAVVVEDSNAGHDSVTEALAAWCREHLEPAERPARWRVVDEIPRSSTGKPLTPALRALFE